MAVWYSLTSIWFLKMSYFMTAAAYSNPLFFWVFLLTPIAVSVRQRKNNYRQTWENTNFDGLEKKLSIMRLLFFTGRFAYPIKSLPCTRSWNRECRIRCCPFSWVCWPCHGCSRWTKLRKTWVRSNGKSEQSISCALSICHLRNT